MKANALKTTPARTTPARTYMAIKKNKGESLYSQAKRDLDKKFKR